MELRVEVARERRIIDATVAGISGIDPGGIPCDLRAGFLSQLWPTHLQHHILLAAI